MFGVCRVILCARHGSSLAEKWTIVSPWRAARRLLAEGRLLAALRYVQRHKVVPHG